MRPLKLQSTKIYDDRVQGHYMTNHLGGEMDDPEVKHFLKKY